MLIRYFLCLLVLIAGKKISFSQIKDSFFISKIEFEGIKNSKNRLLFKSIESKKGDFFIDSILKTDLQRIKNTVGVANAYYQIDTVGQYVDVTYHVTERKTALPIVNFGGVEDNIWVQVGFIDNNFRGDGSQILAYYQNIDGRSGGELFYKQNQFGHSKWGASGGMYRFASEEPLYFGSQSVPYFYNNNGYTLSSIYNWTRKRKIELGATYFSESYQQVANREGGFVDLGPISFEQDKWLIKSFFQEDNRKYDEIYITGNVLSLNAQQVYNTYDNSWFHNFIVQYKKYFRPRPKTNIALRFIGGISTNVNTPFAPFVVDSRVNIRGSGNRIERGTAQIIFNAEIRQEFFEKKMWRGQLVAFSDMGNWRSPGGRVNELLKADEFRHFVGLGVRILYTKIFGAVLRLDYGFDLHNKKQHGLVLGFGQYF